MSKAEERALESYPEDWWFANPSDWGIIENPRKKDYNAEKRAVFILGYKQAEKDLGWISVFDRLPAPSEWVVVCIEHYGRAQCLALATYNYETKEWHTADFEDGEEETVYVDYWMSIPNIIKDAKR